MPLAHCMLMSPAAWAAVVAKLTLILCREKAKGKCNSIVPSQPQLSVGCSGAREWG